MTKITGKIKVIGETQQISDSFKKRELVVETTGQYPQPIMIEFPQDSGDLLDKVAVGQEVEVSINIRGRKWESPQGETKYFNTLSGWRIEAVGQDPVAPQQTDVPPIGDVIGNATDLPF